MALYYNTALRDSTLHRRWYQVLLRSHTLARKLSVANSKVLPHDNTAASQHSRTGDEEGAMSEAQAGSHHTLAAIDLIFWCGINLAALIGGIVLVGSAQRSRDSLVDSYISELVDNVNMSND
eukprot:3646511-Prymnesium_polylepis.1